ncbi:RHS repeat-associated protein [Streptomyces sp. SAI-133]|nr:RHS repeat-associated protein [Streptomyces sp. SAI-133]
MPLPFSPGRSGFGPSLALEYDSGADNGACGFGWHLPLSAISCKTDKGIPRYHGGDTFIRSGAEDLVPVYEHRDGQWQAFRESREVKGRTYQVRRYRPRIEGSFERLEQWTDTLSGEAHWRSISPGNVTTFYGLTPECRIADPADPTRIFSWLICESRDSLGNAIVYEYKPEDMLNIDLTRPHEQGRTAADRSANRYLKRILYGNAESTLLNPELTGMQWHFEMVFDYGEHDADEPLPDESTAWPCRPDPFSSRRAGFEVRTYRLLRRVLMFHHFPGEEGVGRDCLVRSTDLRYRAPGVSATGSFIESVEQSGYRRLPDGGYLRKSLPPLEFRYTEPVIDREIHTLDDLGSVRNLPCGVDGSAYQWIDLNGEGLPGVLTEQDGTWFYKPNLGDGRLGPMTAIASKPPSAALHSGLRFLDLAGDGQLELVAFGGVTPGFQERTADAGWKERSGEGWSPFRPFSSMPRIDWSDPALLLVDLTGDGRADALIRGDEVVTWYPSLGEEGFGEAERVPASLDEDHGPRLVRADPTQAVLLADMTGDQLPDIVRVRNGQICYWPNLGYGRFGPKVTMDDAPWFDEPDQFDARRLRPIDADGSNTADMLYLHRDGARLHLNRNGNGWTGPRALPCAFPRADSLAEVTTLDLLGTGTGYLVWSSSLPSEAGRAVRYLDLMGGRKPHLLTEVRNNLGAETRVHYSTSTRFRLADAAAGRPWTTNVPFPVHVVEQVETIDRISHHQLTARYAYHNPYFDGPEREFRGFGMIEEYTTQAFADLDPVAANVDRATYTPPTLTRTWFHTGAADDAERVSRLYADEYYHGDPDQPPLLLEDTVLPRTLRLPGGGVPWRLSPVERREAYRALKGSMLRQEVYSDDATEAAARPYAVTEHNYTIKLLQPCLTEELVSEPAHAVFFVHPREAVTEHHERELYPDPADGTPHHDPRVGHEAVLAVDDFGNVLRSVSVAYGRRIPDPELGAADQERQTRTHVVYGQTRYTNAVLRDDAYRTPQACETWSYELLGLRPDTTTGRFTFEELTAGTTATYTELPYSAWDADPGRPARRLIEHTRALYRRDDLSGPLPTGVLEPLGLPYESYRLAFSDGLLSELYRDRVSDGIMCEGGYVRHDHGWWIPTGRVRYSPPDLDEADFARQHFFLPQRFLDPFGATTTVAYDAYDLLPLETLDALGNRVTAGERGTDERLVATGLDYRVLRPRLVMDANRNRMEVAFDALGLVIGTAVMGKPGQDAGDSLDGITADPDAVDPLNDPHTLLRGATTRLVYDLFAYQRSQDAPQPQPAGVATLARETHLADLPAGARPRIQITFSYSDGFGREIQKKVQAEPGPVADGGPDISPRWTGTGWTVFNNKGKPVRQYEPFFTATHAFEFTATAGVSSVLFYDPAERVVATVHPDATWEKAVFDPWQQTTWDVNDTVLADPLKDPDVGGLLRPAFRGWKGWYEERADGSLGLLARDAARKAAAHADTPTQVWLDSLGRTFLSAAHNRTAGIDEAYLTRTVLDVEGNERAVVDALGRDVMRYAYDMLSGRVRQSSMEAGERLLLNDVTGKPLYSWNSRRMRFRTEYDVLRRPIAVFVVGADSSDPGRELLCERTSYGEQAPGAVRLNLRTKVWRSFDSAGTVTNAAYDFKGNPLRSRRRLARQYAQPVDWSSPVRLEPESYPNDTRYDALNRPVALTTPDASVVRPGYNEANLLERVDVRLRGARESTVFVADIDYNARGQRTLCLYGNGVRTDYTYDPRTFRLAALRSLRGHEALQDLRYTHDPAGNVTHIEDAAQQAVFFRNKRVDPSADYVYDALYRLVAAAGREHLGQTGPQPPTASDGPRVQLPHPGDGNAMGRYTEQYAYDPVGNLTQVRHTVSDPATPGWTRTYTYSEPSLLEPDRVSNRLTSTRVGEGPAEPYAYDEHGNMTAMPSLPLMRWDHKDQLAATSRAVDGPATHYAYDATGQRVRKVTDHCGTAARWDDRVYLGAFELLREYTRAGEMALERETLHVQAGRQQVALVETRSHGLDEGLAQLARFQLTDHLGSAVLELDENADIVTYEQFRPYGSTAFQSARNRTETPKRYRYTAKERDAQTGLSYHGSRYYAVWLGRWTSCDPIGIADGTNVYSYVMAAPTRHTDPDGQAAKDSITQRAAIGVQKAAEYAKKLVKGGYQVQLEAWIEAGKGRADVVVMKGKDLLSTLELKTIKLLGKTYSRLGVLREAAIKARITRDLKQVLKHIELLEKGGYFNTKTGKALAEDLHYIIRGKPSAALVKKFMNILQREVDTFNKAHGTGIKASASRGFTSIGTSMAIFGLALSAVKTVQGVREIRAGQKSEGGITIGEGIAEAGLVIAPLVLKTGTAATIGGSVIVGAAGIAAGASVALAANTARAAIRGEATPIEKFDRRFGTGFSDIYAWQKRSVTARAAFGVLSLGASESWYALNRAVE